MRTYAKRMPFAQLRFAVAVTLACMVTASQAAPEHAAVGPAGTATVAGLGLASSPVPLAARFSVAVTMPPAAGKEVRAARRSDWYFYRNDRRVSLVKGAIEETWHRDSRGSLSFERVFHEDRRSVEYSAGELATLNVQADWAALSTFVDPAELLSLTPVSRSGRGAEERIRLRGRSGKDSVTIDWLPAWQLPAHIVRRGAAGRVTRIDLVAHAALAPAAWPVPGRDAADYLRMDAADFGDMDYEPVVRKSEALDIRGGWRTAHRHD